MNNADYEYNDGFVSILFNIITKKLNKEYLISIFLFLGSNFLSKSCFVSYAIDFCLVTLEIQIKFTSIYWKVIKNCLQFLYALFYLPFIPLFFYILTSFNPLFDFFWTIFILASIYLFLIFSFPYYLWSVFYMKKTINKDLSKSYYKFTSFAIKIFSSVALLLSINFEIASMTIFLLSLFKTLKFLQLDKWFYLYFFW